jgi:TonB family protein
MPALPGLPRAFADSVIRLLQPHVKRQSRTAKKQNAFLYAAGGSEPRIAIHHFVESAPELINAGLIRSLIDQEIRARRTRDPELPHETKTVQIKMIVATDGSTDDVRVGRSSGDLALNRVARRIAGQMRFTPATIEGIAVPVSVTMPISFPF